MILMTGISTISPDGALVKAGRGGSLVTGDGIWTFSTGKTSTGNSYILLNGKAAGSAAGTELEVANGGKLYAHDASGQWYKYSGSQFLAWIDPVLESTPSPDGTLVKAGSGGGLVTGDGIWTFSAGKTSTGNYYILLNGKAAGSAAAIGLKVANGGKLYSLNAQDQWYQWTGVKWSAVADPSPLITTLVADTGSSSTDGVTSNPAIKGTADANTAVTIKEGSTVLGTATADGTGAWSFTPTGLANGAHTLTVTQTDLAGNIGTATLNFTLDTTAPAVSVTLVAETGRSSTDGITSNPAIQGTGAANTTVTIKEGGTVLGTATTDSTGAWSYTPTGLANGAHTLTVTQTDLAGNTGTATLNLTLDTTAQPALHTADTVSPSSSKGDIVSLKLQNTGTATEPSGYVTFGQAFKAGAVMPGDTLVARIDGVDYAVQMDVKATNSDGSVRHAILTLKAPEIAPGGTAAVTLAKGGTAASSSSSAPSASALLTGGYDVTVSFTFHNSDGTTATDSASAKTALQDAISTGKVEHWLSGPGVNEYDVVTTVDGGKLKVEFDIRAYADGTTTTDVIFDNSWMFSSGKSSLVYDATIKQDGRQVYSASNVSQYLYSMWHHQVDSSGRVNPNVQYDVSYLTNAAALPAYDQTYGINNKNIQTNYDKLNSAISTGYGSTGPMGSAEVMTGMPTTGGRPDIATQPNWVAQWLLSQDSSAQTVMMANADASGSVPWHFTDENTGTLITTDDYPSFWQDPRNAAGSYWSPSPANGWPTYAKNGDPWTPDTAHLPDLNYVPYLVTGSHYQIKLLQAEADYAITSLNPYYAYDNASAINPTKPGSATYMGVATPHYQERAIAWGLREVAEAAYATPDDDPLKSYFSSQLDDAMDGLVKYYITDKSMAQYGDLQGFILGSENASGIPLVSPWQQGYIVTALAEIAGMNLGRASDDAVTMLDYMVDFAAGLYTNGENGYAPENGAAYWLYLKDPTTKTAYSTWSDFSSGNVAAYKLNNSGWGLATASPSSISTNALTVTEGGYGVIAKAAMADLITYTKSPKAIEAYGYLVGQTAVAWGNNSAGQTAAYQNYPMWNVMPRLPDGKYLSADRIRVDTSNNATVTLTATDEDALLAVVGSGTATLTGGNGTDLLFGGSGPTTLIAGAGNDYLFAGKGATTFIDNTGDDYMKGGPAADTFTFSDANSGHDTIVGFKAGTDVLKIAAKLTDKKSAADLVAAAAVVDGSTVLHLGSGHDVTIQGIDTPSSLTDSIVLF